MKNQYCARLLSESFDSRTPGSSLIQAIETINIIEHLEVLTSENQHQIALKLISEADFNSLQRSLQEFASHHQIDIVLKHWQERNLQPGLLIMDMDSTLVQAETIDEIARVAGVVDKVAEITESAMRGELDFIASLHARVSMLEGVSVDAIQSVHERLPLTGGAEALLQKARANGCHTALVSGGFTMFAEPIAKRLGFDTLSANTLEVVDNRLTGRVLGNIVDGQSKLQTLNRLKQQLGLGEQQIVAIGDGANDLPMLSAAGTGIAFHAKPKVQQQANTILNHNNLNAVCWLLNW